jgi:hypothetical protein
MKTLIIAVVVTVGLMAGGVVGGKLALSSLTGQVKANLTTPHSATNAQMQALLAQL